MYLKTNVQAKETQKSVDSNRSEECSQNIARVRSNLETYLNDHVVDSRVSRMIIHPTGQ